MAATQVSKVDDTLEGFEVLARSRRSIRRYTDTPIAREIVARLIESAVWSPSSHNRQPWRFAVVMEPGAREGLARAMGQRLRRDLEANGVPDAVITADTARSYTRMTGAGALIVISLTMADMDRYPDERRAAHERTMAVQSAAMAGQTLLLAAHAAGLGACWMCAPLFCPDVVRAVLELPSDWEPQGVIALGHPAETKDKPRRPLEDVFVWR